MSITSNVALAAQATAGIFAAALLAIWGWEIGRRIRRALLDGFELRWYWSREMWLWAFLRRSSDPSPYRIHRWTLFAGPLELRRWS